MEGVFLKMSVQGVSPMIPVGPSLIRAIGGSVEEKKSTAGSLPLKKTVSRRRPFEFLRIGKREEKGTVRDDDAVVLFEKQDRNVNGNWVLKILEVGSIWNGKRQRSGGGGGGEEEEEEEVAGSKKKKEDLCEECDFCRIDDDDKEEEEKEFDREEFSQMLSKIPVEDAQMFAKLSFLGNLAYSIPKIKVTTLEIETKISILCFWGI